MNIPPIGDLSPHPDIDEWLMSEPFAIPFLGGNRCRFVLDDPNDLDGYKAISVALDNILRLGVSALTDVQNLIFRYRLDSLAAREPDFRPVTDVCRAEDVWREVRFGSELHVSRRNQGDDEDGVYFTLECECDWEEEHGLQIVVRDGQVVSKIGPFDGHLTTSDAYGDRKFKGIVYASLNSLD